MEGDRSDILEGPPVAPVRMMCCVVGKVGGPAVIPSAVRNHVLRCGIRGTKD